MKLARLRDRATGQLRAADTRREAEIVLDSSGRARLPTECGALDDEGLEAFGCAVHRGGQAGRAAADHDQVDLLPGRELAADPKRAGDLTGRRAAQLHATRQTHEGQVRG